MKILLGFCFSLVANFLYSQPEAIEIIEETNEVKREIILYAINNTKDELLMTFGLENTGFIIQDGVQFPFVKNIAPNVKTFLLKLVASKGVTCRYNTSVSYKKIVSESKPTNNGVKRRMTSVQMNNEVLNVFTQDGCPRCEYLISYLEKNKISFVELNTTIHHPNKELMFLKVKETGYSSDSIQLPVVVFKDKTDFNIANIQAYSKKLK